MGFRQGNTAVAAGIAALLILGAGGMACSNDGESAKKYAEEQAKKKQAEKRGTMEVETIDVPIRGGVRIECPDLFTDVAAFSAGIAAGSGCLEGSGTLRASARPDPRGFSRASIAARTRARTDSGSMPKRSEASSASRAGPGALAWTRAWASRL